MAASYVVRRATNTLAPSGKLNTSASPGGGHDIRDLAKDIADLVIEKLAHPGLFNGTYMPFRRLLSAGKSLNDNATERPDAQIICSASAGALELDPKDAPERALRARLMWNG